MGKLNGLMIKTTPLGSLWITGRIGVPVIEKGGFSGFAHLSTLAHALRTSVIEVLISKLKRCKRMESDSIDIWHTIEFRGLAVQSLQLKHLWNVDCCHESCIKVEGAGIFCTRYSSTCQSGSHCEDLRESRMSYEHSDNCDSYAAAMCKVRTYSFNFLQRSILKFSHF